MYIAATRKSSSTQLPLLPLVNNQVALAATSGEKQQAVGRREAMATAAAAWGVATQPSLAASLPVDEEPPKILCDDKCLADLEKIPRQKTASGLEYRDIVVGTGPTPPLGYQVTFDLVATNPANGKTFVNTLEKGKPIDNRVGTDSMVKGLDEALTTMKAGGVRRVYCPGELAYQTPLKAAPGSPAVPAKAPIIFDVALLLVPGLEEEDQSGANEFADLFS
jgi:peptidylprolyl isomerase